MRIKDICLICIFIIFMILLYRIFTDSPSYLFGKYVIEPVPKSVTNIKVKQTNSVGGYGYVLGFKIDEEDLNIIIKSRSLKKVTSGNYDGRYISINYDPSEDYEVLIFQPEYGIKEPKWFHLRSWKNRDTYALIKDNIREILLYNKDKGEVYYYTSHWK